MVRLPSGSTLIDERDSGRVLERKPSGGLRVVGTVGGVRHGGEGGLLGLAVPPGPDPSALFAYYTSETDNRVVSMPLTGTSGSYRLGAQTVVLRGIPSASFHNGGRIAFGPDGLLYVTAGDAGDGTAAQDPDSLGGKILRVTADGKVPSTNPIPNSPVYSLGHRNPQGIAWDSRGILWATEFGQNRWDELNIIRAGANYGWPDIEGIAYEQGFVDPVFQWPTIEASPSGMAIVSDTIFIAALRGERLWVAYSTGDGDVVSALPWFQNTVGRLRDVIAGPEGTVWLLTNNTDGRGEPRQGDDRILQLPLAPRAIAR
jgi:glucose/arabinose dehydrogenase